MNRTTDSQLNNLAEAINEATGSPLTQYTRSLAGVLTANVGNYHISHAYGGVCLHRMSNESGGVSSVFGAGHVPKRELFEQMHAFLRGIEVGKAQAVT